MEDQFHEAEKEIETINHIICQLTNNIENQKLPTYSEFLKDLHYNTSVLIEFLKNLHGDVAMLTISTNNICINTIQDESLNYLYDNTLKSIGYLTVLYNSTLNSIDSLSTLSSNILASTESSCTLRENTSIPIEPFKSITVSTKSLYPLRQKIIPTEFLETLYNSMSKSIERLDTLHKIMSSPTEFLKSVASDMHRNKTVLHNDFIESSDTFHHNISEHTKSVSNLRDKISKHNIFISPESLNNLQSSIEKISTVVHGNHINQEQRKTLLEKMKNLMVMCEKYENLFTKSYQTSTPISVECANNMQRIGSISSGLKIATVVHDNHINQEQGKTLLEKMKNLVVMCEKYENLFTKSYKTSTPMSVECANNMQRIGSVSSGLKITSDELKIAYDELKIASEMNSSSDSEEECLHFPNSMLSEHSSENLIPSHNTQIG